MTKILFGIQGTGNGHISRARVLARYLQDHKLDITYLISGRDKDKLFDMEIFGNFQHRNGLTFVTQNGKIDYWQTAKKNSLLEFWRDIRRLPVDEFDLIITDFEPVCAWAGKLHKKPVLGIGHQYAFGENTPLAGESFLAKKIMKNFAPAETAIGLHWHRYNNNVLPPIIDVSLAATSQKEHVLVYLPFENQAEVTELLKQLPNASFVQYAPDLVDNEQGNVSLRKTCHQAFKDDLTKASAVICNSGFELISECLHLGLPILTKPLNGQMEQHSNALALSQLNYAKVIKQLSLAEIATWLESLPACQAKPLPNVAKSIADWIADGSWQNHHELGAALWQ
ncbi:MJ1255/VC2487 family glycosyltransferase [Colwellia sp. MEBiC06753]